jgi:scyllo-inositol 2-dehydrogenase (NADP+)
MLRIGMVGLGKMGLSHLAIFNSHPELKVVCACDSATYLTDILTKFSGLKCYADLEKMLASEQLDAVVIATPSKAHFSMVSAALEKGLHVFCEKPFVLDVADGFKLIELAKQKGLVTQVGYHYRFVGAFQEAARIAKSGALGDIHHIRAEAYGPVVLRDKGSTWRTAKLEGGGALYDYACHAIDLVNFVAGKPGGVSGVVRTGVFSREVEDEVYCSLLYSDKMSGQLSVNWSDESFRKMSTKISVWGSNGRLTADRQECQIYLREAKSCLADTPQGWTIRYTTDLTKEVWYYLRGEEYSAQVDYFAQSIKLGRTNGESCFASAIETDEVVDMILQSGIDSARPAHQMSAIQPPKKRGLMARLFG